MNTAALVPGFALALALPALADPPQIVGVTRTGDTVSVTLRHPDTGWDHYADAWEVLDTDGARLGLRVLAHPHVNEQPFTRSLSGIGGSDRGPWTVLVRARCNLTGWSQAVTVTVD